jgi:hypothetical protein
MGEPTKSERGAQAPGNPFRIRDRRSGGWYVVDHALIVGGYSRKLGCSGTAVYNSLCHYANGQEKAWPSERRLAAEHGLSLRTVRRKLSVLEELCLVGVVRADGRVNEYQLLDRSCWVPVESARRESRNRGQQGSGYSGGRGVGCVVSGVARTPGVHEQEVVDRDRKNKGAPEFNSWKREAEERAQVLFEQLLRVAWDTRGEQADPEMAEWERAAFASVGGWDALKKTPAEKRAFLLRDLIAAMVRHASVAVKVARRGGS